MNLHAVSLKCNTGIESKDQWRAAVDVPGTPPFPSSSCCCCWMPARGPGLLMWADSLLVAAGWDGSRVVVWGSKLFLSSALEQQLLPLTPPLGASGASAEEATDHLGALLLLFFFCLLNPQYTKPTQVCHKRQQTTETGTLINMQRRTRNNLHPKPAPIILQILCRSCLFAAQRRSARPNCQGRARLVSKANHQKKLKRETLPSPISYLHANRFRLAYISSLPRTQ